MPIFFFFNSLFIIKEQTRLDLCTGKRRKKDINVNFLYVYQATFKADDHGTRNSMKNLIEIHNLAKRSQDIGEDIKESALIQREVSKTNGFAND